MEASKLKGLNHFHSKRRAKQKKRTAAGAPWVCHNAALLCLGEPYYFDYVSPNITLILLSQCARKTTTKHQALHERAALLRAPVHPSTPDSSMR